MDGMDGMDSMDAMDRCGEPDRLRAQQPLDAR